MLIQITRGVWVDGRALAVGDVVDVADSTAAALIRMGKAQAHQVGMDAAETTAVEPPENAALPAAKPRTTATRRKGKKT